MSAGSIQLDQHPHYGLPSNGVPPFGETTAFSSVFDSGGTQLQLELLAKIDKGFFKADADWTCYRRNYFSVACCYCLKPEVDVSSQPLFLQRSNSNNVNRDRIHSFSIGITAKVDGEGGSSIELVQHTPKRDKGPIGPPDLMELSPNPSGTLGVFSTSPSFGPSSQLSSEFDQAFSPSDQSSHNVATFERLQFKKATANNGKRRAAQQYFHIVVELFANINRGKSTEPHNVKIAHKLSAAMVVRGRSPGHYSDERRGSSTSMGPSGGSSGDYGSGPQDPSSTGGSGASHGVSYPQSGPTGGGNYQSQHTSLAHSPTENHSSSSGSSGSSSFGRRRRIHSEVLSTPIMTAEEASQIEEYPGYQYYPSPLYEATANQEASQAILSRLGSTSSRQHADTALIGSSSSEFLNSPQTGNGTRLSALPVKLEQTYKLKLGGYVRGGLDRGPISTFVASKNVSGLPGYCSRFQGMETSKGLYPATPAL
ncbi:hypothetical protein MMC19_003782 [Ptychographa xylographoides]|nr:hypothetical protein [Ptychographa xylographoides]